MFMNIDLSGVTSRLFHAREFPVPNLGQIYDARNVSRVNAQGTRGEVSALRVGPKIFRESALV